MLDKTQKRRSETPDIEAWHQQRVVLLAQFLQEAHPDRTTLIVEHDMAFVRQLAKTVTVLHLGSVLSEGTMEEVQSDPRVIEVYLGHGKKKVA